ncbi:DUF1796 family putative cysteine peptidase [Azospirillum argentinense]|uniref:Uncharacterized protein n=1 Tax=Azospirillum argentinense TaxID=2970906 RepID=A0A5B0KRC6_9PROT|nr:DUF1796 family putative cysteine peptidase [Azospirillum argentinense]KAA1053988.1 hypothetical protein FH063_002223 [Azospirillum argentinense]
MTTYDRIIGLGGNCQVTWQLRNFYGFETAYPFDWWITPWGSLLRLLETDFDGLFLDDGQKIIRNRDTVVCLNTWILHHHDFRRDANGKEVQGGIQEQIPGLRQKYRKIIDRFYDHAGNGRVLFVRNGLNNIPEMPEGTQNISKDPKLLVDALAKKFPNTDFHVLFTNFPKPAISIDRATFAIPKDYHDGNDYRGSFKGWTEMFGELPFRLKKGNTE